MSLPVNALRTTADSVCDVRSSAPSGAAIALSGSLPSVYVFSAKSAALTMPVMLSLLSTVTSPTVSEMYL